MPDTAHSRSAHTRQPKGKKDVVLSAYPEIARKDGSPAKTKHKESEHKWHVTFPTHTSRSAKRNWLEPATAMNGENGNPVHPAYPCE